MKFMLSGSHGLIGSALKFALKEKGHEIIALSRDFSKPLDFHGIDGVIHLGGENIAAKRWSSAQKRRICESRINSTTHLADQIQRSSVKPRLFICASAIGYYGNRGQEQLNEESSNGQGFLSEVCVNGERAANRAANSSTRVVCLRTGMVLSTQGGALKKMLPPFRSGGGGVLGNGLHYMSWISLDDAIAAICFIIHNEHLTGPINIVSPHPVTNYTFTKTLRKTLHRPTILGMPAVAVRFIFGKMADELLLSSTKVVPTKLLSNGYTFKHAELSSALKDILK